MTETPNTPLEAADPAAQACVEDLRLLAPGAGDDDLVAAGTDVAARWEEPQRHYHSLRHLLEMLAAITRLAPAAGLDPRQVAVARAAAWFHDAVYDPTADAGANEEASAVLAIDVLDRLGAPADVIEDVARLVAATADHAAAQRDPLTDVVVDADLAVLGAGPARFDEYCRQVRAEYAHVPDAQYATARAAVLRGLTTGRLYRTDLADELWGEQAHENLARELARLDA